MWIPGRTLLTDGKTYVPLIDEKAANQRKLDNPLDLKLKLEKGFEMWKENVGIKTAFNYMKNSDATRPDTWEIANITIAEFSQVVLGENIFISAKPKTIPLISKEEPKSIPEKEPENSGEAEKQRIATNSLIPCPECRAKGKPMFFGSDVDLRNHVSACHYSEESMQEGSQ